MLLKILWLYLDAADNPAHPKAWENLGTEGGELLVAGQANGTRRRRKLKFLSSVSANRMRSITQPRNPIQLLAVATQKSTTVFRGLDIGIPL